MIPHPNGSIDYEETGEGPTVVLVPGSCSTGDAWHPVIAHWRGFRCVTTSLLGYGRTAERRTSEDAGITREAEIIEAAIRYAGRGPVHLVGHSFGGLVALAVALRRRVPLLSLTVAEAPAAEILRPMREFANYFAFRKVTDDYGAAFRAGDGTAVAQMIDFLGGAGTFGGWSPEARDYAIETTATSLLDWKCTYGFALTPSLLAAVTCPTLVLWGQKSHPAVRRANELLGRCISRGSTMTVPGAAHFMISTHARQVADAIARHVASVQEFSFPAVSAAE